MSQQPIINPEKRDPSIIRNKAEIGLSRVDNVSFSDIHNSIKEVIKDEVYRGDLYAEDELRELQRFELPICEFTSESTAFSIVVSFLDSDLKVKSSVKANISHSFELGSTSKQNFDISFDLLSGQAVLSSSGEVAFNLYEPSKDSSVYNQAFLSIVCGSKLNILYNISYVSYYFLDYVFSADEKREVREFTQLPPNIVIGEQIDHMYGDSFEVSTYYCKDGNRKISSVTKSLPIYNSYGELINLESLAITEEDNYSIPTINGVPFTGSNNISYNNISTRDITIYSKHSEDLATTEVAGEHDWAVLHTIPVVKYSSSSITEEEDNEVELSSFENDNFSDAVQTFSLPRSTVTTSAPTTSTVTSSTPITSTVTSSTPITSTTSPLTSTTTKKPATSAGNSATAESARPIDPNSMISNYANVEYCSKESSAGSGLCTLVDIPAMESEMPTSLDDAVGRLVSFTENVSKYNDEHVVSIGYLRRYTQYLQSVVNILIDHFNDNTDTSSSAVSGKFWFYELKYNNNNVPDRDSRVEITAMMYPLNKDEVKDYGFSFTGFSNKEIKIRVVGNNSPCKINISYWKDGSWKSYGDQTYKNEITINTGMGEDSMNDVIFKLQLKAVEDIYLNGSVIGRNTSIESTKTLSLNFTNIPKISAFRRTINGSNYIFPVILHSIGYSIMPISTITDGFTYRNFDGLENELVKFWDNNSSTSWQSSEGLLWHNVTSLASGRSHYETSILLPNERNKILCLRGFSLVRKLKFKVNTSGKYLFRVYTKNQKTSTGTIGKFWSDIYGSRVTEELTVDLWGDNSSIKPIGPTSTRLSPSNIDYNYKNSEFPYAEEFLIAIQAYSDQVPGQWEDDIRDMGELVIGSDFDVDQDYLTIKTGQRSNISDLISYPDYDSTRFGSNNVIVFPNASNPDILEGQLVCSYEGIPGPLLKSGNINTKLRAHSTESKNDDYSEISGIELGLSFLENPIHYKFYSKSTDLKESNYYIPLSPEFETNPFSLIRTGSLSYNYIIKIASRSTNMDALNRIKSISLEENDGLRKQVRKKNYPFGKKCNKIPCNIVQAKRLYLSSSKINIGCGVLNSAGVPFSIPSNYIILTNFTKSSDDKFGELTYSNTNTVVKSSIGVAYFDSLSQFIITLTQDTDKSNVDLNQLYCAYKLEYTSGGNGDGLVGTGWIGQSLTESPSFIKTLFSSKDGGYNLLVNVNSLLNSVKLNLTKCSEVTFNLQLAFFQKEGSNYVMVHTSERSNIIIYNITLKLIHNA